ncbi:MAG: phosphoadenylyl-sulfate reductase [Sandaracinaceae bacterium]
MHALQLVPPPDDLDLDRVNAELASADALETLRWAAATFGDGLVMTSSFGSHSALMLHLVTRVVPKVPVIFLDTGYLFPETYQFAEALRARLDLRLEVVTPRMTAARQEALYGRLYDGDDDELQRYQELNKVEPLQRALRELGATGWLAGLRAEQTAFRSGLRKVERQSGVLKIHPILDWTSDEVEAYLAEHDLPHHPLYAWGYRSIGDAHSTVPTQEGQDPRDGRRLGDKRECGIHLPATPDEDASLRSSGL